MHEFVFGLGGFRIQGVWVLIVGVVFRFWASHAQWHIRTVDPDGQSPEALMAWVWSLKISSTVSVSRHNAESIGTLSIT